MDVNRPIRRNYQILTHLNVYEEVWPEKHGHIFGIFFDNIKASKQYLRLKKVYGAEIQIKDQHLMLIGHSEECPDYKEVFQLTNENRKRCDLFGIGNSYTYFDDMQNLSFEGFMGKKLYVIRSSPKKGKEEILDEMDQSYVGGVYLNRCCAEKQLQQIIHSGLYYQNSDITTKEDKKKVGEFLPIIQEFTEGVSDPDFEKERKAYQDFNVLFKQMEKDSNHPGREWLGVKPNEPIEISNYHWSCWFDDINSWQDLLNDYLKWIWKL